MKSKLTQEQEKLLINNFKKIILENNNELIDYERYKDGFSLYHKGSKLPFKSQLYVSINPRVKKFFVGFKLFTINGRDKFREIYNSLPFDMKGKFTEAVKYSSIQSEVKMDENIDQEKIRIINDSVNFYKQYFKEFMNLSQ